MLTAVLGTLIGAENSDIADKHGPCPPGTRAPVARALKRTHYTFRQINKAKECGSDWGGQGGKGVSTLVRVTPEAFSEEVALK